MHFNGNPTPTLTINLNGTIAPGDDGAIEVATDAEIAINFSVPVAVAADWYRGTARPRS